MGDSEKLSDLPTKDSQPAPHESDIMNRFFSVDTKKGDSKMNWKLIGYTVILYLLLGNPWIDIFMGRIPHCKEYPIILFAIKVMIFIVLLVVVSKYLV